MFVPSNLECMRGCENIIFKLKFEVKVVISVCLFVCLFGCPMITQGPLDRFASNFDWESCSKPTGMFLVWFKNSNFSGLSLAGEVYTGFQV